MSRGVIHAIDELAPRLLDFDATLRRPRTFLDVGTRVGWLAIEAARTWPALRVVGVDPWQPSLNLGRQSLATPAWRAASSSTPGGCRRSGRLHLSLACWTTCARRSHRECSMAIRKALKPRGWLVESLGPVLRRPEQIQLGKIPPLKVTLSNRLDFACELPRRRIRFVGAVSPKQVRAPPGSYWDVWHFSALPRPCLFAA